MPRNLCPELRGRIIRQSQAGRSITAIAANIPCSEKTVRRWIRRFAKGGDDALKDHRVNNHGPRKTSPEEEQALVAAIADRPFSTIQEAINAANVQISETTARRRLNEAGYYYRYPAHKIPLRRIKFNNYIERIVRNYINIDFTKHFRLSRKIANELIARFEISDIFTSLQEHAGYIPITSEKYILSYLWFLGHESAGYRDVSDRFDVTIDTLCTIITRVTKFLMQLAPQIIKFPTLEEKEATKTHFLQLKGFPGIIGCIDSTHIRIDKPQQDHESYINRKQYFSIHMQATVDHNMKFIDVFIGNPGSVHDARVFKESPLYKSLQEICSDGSYLLGDRAYPCLKNLIIPYRDTGHLTRAQKHFNQRLSSCHVKVENAIDWWKQRFRQLYHFKLQNIVHMVQIIHASCVLHNLANKDDLELLLESPSNDDYPDPEAVINIENDEEIIYENQHGCELRDKLCHQLYAR
ncbi:PREDICTED: putative nuclease HARBI1 [Trachymyrmex cornetzi]|uniref:putative nuclease HARBI1 n=1 Tax=Trachymyrmex cornetzi TaxID=471704 RepID=UPI00084F06CB|nr:PREDICTED: putative nuclease HARBI1 [Trachymyrmex cornetzi]